MPRVASGRWTRIGVPVVLAAAVALLVGIVTGAGPSRGASTSSKSGGSGVATVQRRDLVATDTESGTLSYADPQTIFNRVSGTITWLPSVGRVVTPGGALYKVSGQPVILMNGTVPAYRDLSDGVVGPDVQELEQNLVALGFDPDHQITVDNTFDAATTAAVERWQASLGETQTGIVSLGDVVFLPGSQRITQVNTVLGSNGGSTSGSAASGTTGASLHLGPAQGEFVSLTTTATTTSTTATTSTSTTSSATTTPNCPTASTVSAASAVAWQRAASDCPLPNNPDQKSNSQALQLQALIALLKAETAELRQKNSAPTSGGSTSGSGSGSASGPSGGSGSSGRSSGSSGASASSLSGGSSGSSGSTSGGTSSSGSSGGTSSSGSSGGTSSSGSSGGTVQAILQSTSTQVVVTVDLDATKQTEATVGEPVTVELPDGSTVNGKITEVSPVAQTSSSSSSSGGGSGSGSGSGSSGGGSSSPSATIPVTIALAGHRRVHGLDQAAVSVNFEQQKATNVLSVPVTALIATAGGGYAVQEAAAPHRLLPVSPGLFAAGYVQISGAQITPGLQVTDSQG